MIPMGTQTFDLSDLSDFFDFSDFFDLLDLFDLSDLLYTYLEEISMPTLNWIGKACHMMVKVIIPNPCLLLHWR